MLSVYLFSDFAKVDAAMLSAAAACLPQAWARKSAKKASFKGKLDCVFSYYLLYHAFLAETLAAPGTIHWTAKGKPYIPNSKHFSYSHSDAGIVCVLNDLPIGIDLETIRPCNTRVAEKVCTFEEILLLNPLPPEERAETFISYWVKKEAFSKMTGNGFSEGFRTIDAIRDKRMRAQGITTLSGRGYLGLAAPLDMRSQQVTVIPVSLANFLPYISK